MKCYAWCLALVLISAMAFAGSSEALDWPQWQGPDRDAVSKERGLLKEWPKDGPPLAWEVKGLGGGYSAPSVADGRIFGMSNRGNDEVVWALSEKDGKELWVTRLGPPVPQRMPQGREGPGCTPTVDGDRRGRFRQPDRSGSPAWAHPVLANGKLYLRDQDVLLCYDVRP